MANITLQLYTRDHSGIRGDATSLPTFYMNDWSELGLRVNARQPALDLLRGHGVGVSDTPSGTRLHFASLGQIAASVELLQQKGYGAELSDVVPGVYQG